MPPRVSVCVCVYGFVCVTPVPLTCQILSRNERLHVHVCVCVCVCVLAVRMSWSEICTRQTDVRRTLSVRYTWPLGAVLATRSHKSDVRPSVRRTGIADADQLQAEVLAALRTFVPSTSERAWASLDRPISLFQSIMLVSAGWSRSRRTCKWYVIGRLPAKFSHVSPASNRLARLDNGISPWN